MTTKGRKLSLLSLILVAVLVLATVFNVSFAKGTVNATTKTATPSIGANTNNTFKNVTGSVNFDSLREQYLNAQKVEKNTVANYEGERWVIVELEGENLYSQFERSARYSEFEEYCDSAEGKKAKSRLERTQSDFLAKLQKHNIDYILKYSYTTLNNGVAIKVNADGYNAIKKMSGVLDVYYSEAYTVPTVAVSNNANVYTTGIYDSSKLDYKGEGMVVAVLDTGLDYTHEAFQTMPNPDTMSWNKDYVASLLQNPELNAKGTVDQIYYNDKVPFAYDYADDDTDVYPSYSTHGTHVAGIVAGSSDYKVNKDDPTETFIGVAPEAQLVICKVFTDNLDSDSLGGADSIDILAAVSDCAEIGVDVINMSLGSSCGFADEKSDQFLKDIYEKVRSKGISLVVAASNDYSSGFGGGNGTNLASNPDSATVGSPSTYPAALSVASINGRLSSYVMANDDENQVAFITEASDENGNDYDFIEQLYKVAGKDKSQTLKFKYVTVGGVGRATNYTASIRRELANKDGYDGTIALVRRGDNTFAEKVQNAMDNGADACIIYNNLSGTIHMSLGEVSNPIPTCSIGMDAGKLFATKNKGTIKVSYDYKAGPFMSDFSSWGPTPDLQLKPEITAHGGEIVSAVPGGYDVYSGTSMASPNMAGAVALLRQYLKNTTGLTGVELNARVNQVLMSTATIALNEEGNPYSPRKQGAGLAGIKEAIETESYITVTDAKGEVRDRTKLELGDDKTKSGVYTLNFVINNISGEVETYAPITYVMTETLASDNKTVAEKAYMLNDSTIEYYVNGASEAHQGNITVGANEQVSIKVVIKLSDNAKSYLDKSFENGMYVEGFVSLQAQKDAGTNVTIGLPYLAFYGDWTDAPLFDYDTYEIAESEADTGVDPEDKLKASAAATRALGLYYDDQYILDLGAYIYNMSEEDVQIYPDREKAAVSIFDTPNNRTIYEMYMVYAGLLRNAAYMDIVITDSLTGEVVYSQKKENVGKSHASGGANVGSPIMLEINPLDWNLNNNRTYKVSLKGQLDYPGGENPEKNTFDFQFTVDYEAPQMLEYRIRYEAYTENKQTKYRIYMDIDVSDNQYVMDVMPCYIKQTRLNNVLTLVSEYPIPVYGQKGETSTVSFEITDIFDDYVKTGKLLISVEDYAMNQSIYQIDLDFDESVDYPETVELVEDGKLFFEGTGTNADSSTYGIYELSLAPNELYKLSYTALPNQEYFQNLKWTGVGATVKAQGDEIFGARVGKAALCLTDGTKTYAQIHVEIAGTALEAPIPEKITLLPVENKGDYVVSLDGTLPTLELNPNQTVRLRATVSPWYVSGVEFEWSSTNEDIVRVDANSGSITALKKGNAQVKVIAKGYSRLSKSIRVSVGSDYRVISYRLYDYYGGPIVEIPEDLNIMYLDEECFQGNTTIEKVVLPASLTELPKNAFKGCTSLKEIIVPSQCIVINESAFEGCTSLQRIEFKMFEDRDHNVSDTLHGAITIGKNAFKGCAKLNEITNQERLTTIYDNAFEGCTSLTDIDLTQLRVTGAYAFKDCTNLTNVKTVSATNIGEYMFFGCTKLESFTFKGSKLNVGAFMGCTNLANFTFAPEGEFLGISAYALANTAVENITLPNGNYPIEESVFADCTKLATVALSANTQIDLASTSPFIGCNAFTAYEANGSNVYSVDGGVLYNKEMTSVVSVPTGLAEITIPASVTVVGSGAFAGVANMQSVELNNIVNFGKYAFAKSGITGITIPQGMTSLPDGAFFGCEKLQTVNGAENLIEVGKQAFALCKSLTNINLENAVKIHDGAFQNSGLATIVATKAEIIGAHAFEGSAIQNIELPVSKELGYRAFASIPTLISAQLGAITEMASNVFADSANIQRVEFGEGTTIIGDFAFYAENGTALKTVILPNSVETIGRYAFSFADEIESINLSGVKTIGDFAFIMTASYDKDNKMVRDSKLTVVDLANATYIGVGAFAYTNIETANLAKAKVVDDGAFADSTLSSVTFGALERVGSYAFAGTQLQSVTLPSTFAHRQYEYTWVIKDHKDRVVETKHRNELSYGAGAFADIDTLESISVEGEGDFFSVDGVLYSRIPDGVVLEQYPANRDGKQYGVIDGTIAIGDFAFEGVSQCIVITFPYTVKRIGDGAFYQSSVSEYTFTSVQAPTLESSYYDATATEDELMFLLFNANMLGSTIYYANFHNYVAINIESDKFTTPTAYDFGLTLNIPKNGQGYDSIIWTNFFSTINKSKRNEADDMTHVALDAIANLPTVDEIMAVASLDELTRDGGFADMVKEARQKYNEITLSEQVAIAQASYETLLKAERAMRDRKAQLGAPVAIDKLVIASSPNKIRYDVGDHFDKTGLEIIVLFVDGSEIDVTAECTFDIDVITANDNKVVATYVADGQTYSVDININVNQVVDPNPVDPVDPVTPTNPTDEKDGVDAVTIALPIVAGVLFVIGAVIAIILIKKKKAQKPADEQENGVNADEKVEENVENAENAEQANENSDENAENAEDGDVE